MERPTSPAASVSLLEPLVARCRERAVARLDDPRIEPDLRRTFRAYWDTVHASNAHRRRDLAADVHASVATPAGLFLLVTMGENGPIDDAALDAGAGAELYTLALTLFDAVQDEELEPPVSQLGGAAATNAALIMFVQGCDAILRLGERGDARLHKRLHETFLKRSLMCGAGQHRDLRGVRPATIELAAAQSQDKTAAIPMIAELAALASSADERRVELYGRIGASSALVRQCGNDLRDLYGKRVSDDLRTGKWTLPLAAFWHCASEAQRSEFQNLACQLPESTEGIRRLLLEAGAIHEVARVMERARREIHDGIDELGLREGPIALLAGLADATTSRLYNLAAA